MAPLSLQSKQIPQLLLGRHYVWTTLNYCDFSRSNPWRFWTSAGIPSKIHRFEAQKLMEIGVFFLGLRFQHLWPGKLWKGTGGWNGENQDVVLKLGAVGFNDFDFQWVVFSSSFCYLSFNLTFSSLEISMARRHLCDPLLVPLELKRLGDWWMLRVTLVETLPPWSNIISFLWVFFAGIRACNGILFDEHLHVLYR